MRHFFEGWPPQKADLITACIKSYWIPQQPFEVGTFMSHFAEKPAGEGGCPGSHFWGVWKLGIDVEAAGSGACVRRWDQLHQEACKTQALCGRARPLVLICTHVCVWVLCDGRAWAEARVRAELERGPTARFTVVSRLWWHAATPVTFFPKCY